MKASARLVRNVLSVGCVVSWAASRRSEAASASSPWYSIEYGTDTKRPSGPRRMVVKKPVAAVLALPVSESSHFWISSFVAPAG